VTAVITAPPAASWAPPHLRLDTDAKIDRAVRVGGVLALWLGLLLVTYWWVVGGGIADLAQWGSGLTSVGRLTGLWAADLLLVQVLLMSRLPPLEHAFGRDRLARIHRVVGLLSCYLMISHIVLIISGYASGQLSAVLMTTWQLITAYGGILLAVAGTACLIMVVITSVKAARRRLRYESWHLLHLNGYLGVGLALPHQLWTGQEFLQSPAATVFDQCPAEVAEVLELGREAEQASEGAFSIMLPTADGRRRLDPSGVVKGWAVQRASMFLAALEETDFCLSAGGDIVCHTALPDSAAWRIGIEDPHNPTRLIAMVPVRSGAVATSGTAHRGDHLVDPRTGQPPKAIASVTVIEASLTWADIDATAAYVHGPDAAGWLQTRPIDSALIIWADGAVTRISKTSSPQ
jgi:DMSO/TMAO reductase YedYZ heme-binding membrane subunit